VSIKICIFLQFADYGFVTGPKYVTTSISFPDPDLLELAKGRADRLGLSFSKYVAKLLVDDIERGGDFVLRERTAISTYTEERAQAAALNEFSPKKGEQ
jgi:hypothetical protein